MEQGSSKDMPFSRKDASIIHLHFDVLQDQLLYKLAENL